MATKILGTSLREDDIQFLLGLAKDAKQRRIIKGLFGYQLKQIEQNNLKGIDNCKQFHNTWLEWIINGCRPECITSRRHKHGFKARLQYAQRLYITYVQEGQSETARKWRDTVTTVLRSYQVCGPSKEDMETMWNDSIRENITQPLGRNELIALIRGCMGIPSRYNEPCHAQDVYDCAMSIKSYFDMIEKTPRPERKGFYKALSSLVPQLKAEDYSLLIKKGPHKVNNETIVSIFGQGLDIHVLSQTYCDASTVNIEDICRDPSSIEDIDLFSIHTNNTLLEMVDDLCLHLLDSYKNSPVRHKDFDSNLCYSKQKPQGTIPAFINAAPGRTVLLQDKAGKTRPVSIATYTVNNALAPLHKQMFKILARIRQDSTNQIIGINHICDMTSKSDSFICSADLSAATDRLPVDLQAYVLYRLLKLSKQKNAMQIANCWLNLMSGTPFKDPCSDSYFRYGAGQPMGVYTSWPMLALTNHIMIRSAYYKCRDKSLDYLVCGDDTVIGSEKPFLYYETWMNSLGVKINRSKSHVCTADQPNKVAEFCKRLAVNGQIVSSESPKVLIRASRDRAYQPAAIECIHSMLGPISNTKLANLVGRRIGDRRLPLPFRYGGWGQRDNRSLSEVLLEDDFIFLFVYKKLRSSVTALETIYSSDMPEQQTYIDNLSVPEVYNPNASGKKDWRLMGSKVYTPINLCRDNLRLYEDFITGGFTPTPQEVLEIVEQTLDSIDKCTIPVKISSKEDNTSKSKLAITYQRLYTRTMRNITSRNIHVYSKGVQPISIEIDWDGEPMLTTKDFVEALDQLIFR